MDGKKQSPGCGGPESAPDTMGHTGGSTDREAQDHVQPSGAKRSEKMPYYSAIPGMSLRLLALRATGAPRGVKLIDKETGVEMEGGSDKYGYGNWAKGLEFEDTFNHVIDHLFKAKAAMEVGNRVGALAELSGAAWGIMLPLMTFTSDYCLQFTKRQARVSSLTGNAAMWDEDDDAAFPLLKPLTPALVIGPKEGKKTHAIGLPRLHVGSGYCVYCNTYVKEGSECVQKRG